MRIPALSLPVLLLLTASPVAATEVFRWVDENGVVHFSQSAPPANVPGVTELILEDTERPGDTDEDLYGVEAQAERMAQLREEMAKKRELAKERNRNQARQPMTQYQQSVLYDYPFYGRPPYFPGLRPPSRPEPPLRPGPYPTDSLRPAARLED